MAGKVQTLGTTWLLVYQINISKTIFLCAAQFQKTYHAYFSSLSPHPTPFYCCPAGTHQGSRSQVKCWPHPPPSILRHLQSHYTDLVQLSQQRQFPLRSMQATIVWNKDKVILTTQPSRQDTKGFCKRTKNLLCCSPLQDAAGRKEEKRNIRYIYFTHIQSNLFGSGSSSSQMNWLKVHSPNPLVRQLPEEHRTFTKALKWSAKL